MTDPIGQLLALPIGDVLTAIEMEPVGGRWRPCPVCHATGDDRRGIVRVDGDLWCCMSCHRGGRSPQAVAAHLGHPLTSIRWGEVFAWCRRAGLLDDTTTRPVPRAPSHVRVSGRLVPLPVPPASLPMDERDRWIAATLAHESGHGDDLLDAAYRCILQRRAAQLAALYMLPLDPSPGWYAAWVGVALGSMGTDEHLTVPRGIAARLATA